MDKETGKAKYYVLMEELRAQISAGTIRPGEKLPSENELCARHGISRHTVRKALTMLENEGLVEAFHGKGTFCSERVRHMKKSGNIAVITTYITDYIFPRLLQGIDRVLSENGYSIILKNTGNSRRKEAACLEEMLSKDIDGLIIEPSKSQMACSHGRLYRLLDEYQIPYIFIQGIYEGMEDKPHILMDDCRGGYLVTKYLIQTGHKSIAGIFKADDVQGRERHKGYVKALQESGFLYDPDLVIWYHTEDRRSKPLAGIRHILEQGAAPDGIVCYNDQIAAAVIAGLEELGLHVPEDLSVTGYDNSHYVSPSGLQLTTIVHPQEKMGEMAAELLLEKLKGIPESESQVEHLIRPELLVRDSVRARN